MFVICYYSTKLNNLFSPNINCKQAVITTIQDIDEKIKNLFQIDQYRQNCERENQEVNRTLTMEAGKRDWK